MAFEVVRHFDNRILLQRRKHIQQPLAVVEQAVRFQSL